LGPFADGTICGDEGMNGRGWKGLDSLTTTGTASPLTLKVRQRGLVDTAPDGDLERGKCEEEE